MWGWASEGPKFRMTVSGTNVALFPLSCTSRAAQAPAWRHPCECCKQEVVRIMCYSGWVFYELLATRNDLKWSPLIFEQELTILCTCFLFCMVKEWMQHAMEKVTLRTRRRWWVCFFWPQRKRREQHVIGKLHQMAAGCFPAVTCIEDEEQWLEGNTSLQSVSGCVQEVWECVVNQHSLWSVCEEPMSHIVNCWSQRKGVSGLFDRIWFWMVLKAEEKLEYCCLAIMLEPSLCLYAVSSINRFCNVQSYDAKICK